MEPFPSDTKRLQVGKCEIRGESQFRARLERTPVLQTVVPTWDVGDTIPLGADRMLRVIETRFLDEKLVLVVEPA